MALRSNHYDVAFEAWLRARRTPYVAVDESRRALMADASLKSFDFIVYSPGPWNLLVDVKGRRFPSAAPTGHGRRSPAAAQVEHGRRFPSAAPTGHGRRLPSAAPTGHGRRLPSAAQIEHGRRLPAAAPLEDDFAVQSGAERAAGQSQGHCWENWATQDDLDGLLRWQEVFGGGFRSLLVFAYLLADERWASRHPRTFEFRDRTYAFYGVWVEDYAASMTPRSRRWSTVTLPAAAYRRLRTPLDELLADPAAPCNPVSVAG